MNNCKNNLHAMVDANVQVVKTTGREICKACVSARRRSHYQANREVILERNRQYRVANSDRIKQQERLRYSLNKELFSERARANRASYKERIIANRRRYYAENRELIIEKSRNYYDANKDRVSETGRHYRDANRPKIADRNRAYQQRNKDQRSEKNRLYRELNKEKLRELNRKKNLKSDPVAVEKKRQRAARVLRATRLVENPRVGRWTAAEDAIALRTDISHLEKALLLRRTIGSVSGRIKRLGDPAGVAETNRRYQKRHPDRVRASRLNYERANKKVIAERKRKTRIAKQAAA